MGILDAPISSSAIGRTLARNPTRNLFNWRTATDGFYIDAAGNIAAAAGLTGISDFIPVTPGQQYACSYANVANGIRMHCFYDAARTVVPGGNSLGVGVFTAPAGAAFVRVTYDISNRGKRHFQLEAGSVGTRYVPYVSGLPAEVDVRDVSVRGLSLSENLFDPAEALDGFYMDQNGNMTASAAFGVSGYIPVESGRIYRASDWVGVGSGGVADNGVMRFTTFFDANFAVVAGGASSANSQINVPAGVAFVRFSYNIVTTNGMTTGKASIQFQLASTTTKYVPFSRSLAADRRVLERVPSSPVWGAQRLRRWHAWKRAPSYSYDLVLHGDSYTDGNYFARLLRQALLARGFSDGGPGLLAFFGADGAISSQSIEPTQFYCAFASGDWSNVVAANSWGPSATHVTSASAGKVITVTSTTPLATVTLIYRRQSGGAGFTYQINGGAAVTVSTANTTPEVGSTVIDTTAAGGSFTLTLTALGAGVEIAGAVGRKAGSNLLTVHKAGLTGSHASMWGKQPLYKDAVALLLASGKGGFAYCWGTNDQNGNILPSVVKGHVQNLANYARAVDPICDLMFVAPPETSYAAGKAYRTDEYADVFYQLARENTGAAFVGLPAIFGPYSGGSITSGLFHADAVHPGTLGSPLIADAYHATLV
jgi:hypothetical protein